MKNGKIIASDTEKLEPEIYIPLGHVKFLLGAGKDGIKDQYSHTTINILDEAMRNYEILIDPNAKLETDDEDLRQLYEKGPIAIDRRILTNGA